MDVDGFGVPQALETAQIPVHVLGHFIIGDILVHWGYYLLPAGAFHHCITLVMGMSWGIGVSHFTKLLLPMAHV